MGKQDEMTRHVLQAAWGLSCAMGHSYVGTEHLLVGIAMTPQTAACRQLRWEGLTDLLHFSLLY